MPLIDRTGKRYGDLLVIKRVPAPLGYTRGSAFWQCRCLCSISGNVCNKIVEMDGRNLARRNRSCLSCAHIRMRVSKGSFTNSGELLPGGFASVYDGYRRHAIDISMSFSISKEYLFNLSQLPCYYCGRTKVNEHKYGSSKYGTYLLTYNGVDRKDNSIGYTPKNSIPCCGPCNRMKRSMSQKDFIELVNLIANNLKSKEVMC